LVEFSQLVRGTVDYLIELSVDVLFNHLVIIMNFDFSFSQHEKLDSKCRLNVGWVCEFSGSPEQGAGNGTPWQAS
jgi:hypothetical protein